MWTKNSTITFLLVIFRPGYPSVKPVVISQKSKFKTLKMTQKFAILTKLTKISILLKVVKLSIFTPYEKILKNFPSF